MITIDDFKQKMNTYDDYVNSLRDNFNNPNISEEGFKDLNPRNNIIGGFLSNYKNTDLFNSGVFLSNFFNDLDTLDYFIYIFPNETKTENLTKFIEDTLLNDSMNVDTLYNGPNKAKSSDEKEAEFANNIRQLENMNTTQFSYSLYLNGAFENTASNIQNDFNGDKYLRIFEIIIYWKLFNVIKDTKPEIITKIDSIFRKFENTSLIYAELNDDEKAKLKSTTLIDVLNYAFQQDKTSFNKFVIYSPCPSMVFQNNEFYDPLELVINGYRVPLYKYFTHDIFRLAEKDNLVIKAEQNEKLAAKSNVVQSLMDKNKKIKLITDIFNNYFATRGNQTQNNRYENKRADITNDILFIAIVAASFFNCPITSTILQSLIRCRFNEKEYRTSAYEIVNNTLSNFIRTQEPETTAETPKKVITSDDYILYSSFIKKFTDNSGDYILPSWPFNEFYKENEFDNIIISTSEIQKISLGYIVMFSADFIDPIVIDNKNHAFSRVYDLIGQIYRISLSFRIKTNAGTMDYNPNMITFNCRYLEKYNERINKYSNSEKLINQSLSPIYKLLSNFSKDLTKEEKETIIDEHIRDIIKIITYLNKYTAKIKIEETNKITETETKEIQNDTSLIEADKKEILTSSEIFLTNATQEQKLLEEETNANYTDINAAVNAINNLIFGYGKPHVNGINGYRTKTTKEQITFIKSFLNTNSANYNASPLEIAIVKDIQRLLNIDESSTLYNYFSPMIKMMVDKIYYIAVLKFRPVKTNDYGYCLIPSTRNINIENEQKKLEAQQKAKKQQQDKDWQQHVRNMGITAENKANQAIQDEKHENKIILETGENMIPDDSPINIPYDADKTTQSTNGKINNIVYEANKHVNTANADEPNKMEGGGRKRTIRILKTLCFIGFILLVVVIVVHLIIISYDYEEENIYNDYDN